jgi:hypothetical protein
MTEPTQRGSEGELANCPFCRTADHLSLRSVGSVTADMHARPYQVMCHHLDCEAVSGPVAYGKDAAIAAWNRRPASPVGVSAVTDEMVAAAMSAASEAYDTLPSSAAMAGYVSVFHPAVFRAALQAVLSPPLPMNDTPDWRAKIIAALDGHTRFSRDCNLSGEYLASLVFPIIEAACQAALSPKGEAPETTCADASDAITSLQTERDEAREYGAKARIRERDAEDARISAVDEASRLQSQLTEAREALIRLLSYYDSVARDLGMDPDRQDVVLDARAALTNLQPAGKDKPNET